MTKTTKGIIKCLPISEEVKNELYTKVDSSNLAEKYRIQRLVWNTYETLYECMISDFYQQLSQEAFDKLEEVDMDALRHNAMDKAKRYMDEKYEKGLSVEDLSSVREKLQELMQPVPPVQSH